MLSPCRILFGVPGDELYLSPVLRPTVFVGFTFNFRTRTLDEFCTNF